MNKFTEEAFEAVRKERHKQIQMWDTDHMWHRGQLATGAVAYVLNQPMIWPPEFHPLSFKSIKEVGYEGQLIRAAAMLLAELERVKAEKNDKQQLSLFPSQEDGA